MPMPTSSTWAYAGIVPQVVAVCPGHSVLGGPGGWGRIGFDLRVYIVTSCWWRGRLLAMVRCGVCGRVFAVAGRGRRPSVCGQRCRKRKSRAALPGALTGLVRWCVADGKRPRQVCGRPASSTNAATWTDYASVAAGPKGVMLGDGLACFDLDGVIAGDGSLHPDAVAVLADVADPVWVERSLSGRGLHVFVWSDLPSFQRQRVSFYSWGRFIVVTGDAFLATTNVS